MSKKVIKNVSVYRDDFKIDSEGNSYFIDLLEQLGIPEEQFEDIAKIDLTIIEYETD